MDQYSTAGTIELPEHTATVSAFVLDAYEVTVGRFRRFVDDYHTALLTEGAGANPNVSGTGWKSTWNGHLPADQGALRAALQCDSTFQTWRDEPEGTETLPINCVDWYLAVAFCAWDGGWLPTEAEWEKAAAGGDENRLFPWGQVAPNATLAAYGCFTNCSFSDILAVGSKPAGKGRWGHYDLAGNMREWAFDAFHTYTSEDCTDCANTTEGTYRMLRGGSFHYLEHNLRAAYRSTTQNYPPDLYFTYGFRCARRPQ